MGAIRPREDVVPTTEFAGIEWLEGEGPADRNGPVDVPFRPFADEQIDRPVFEQFQTVAAERPDALAVDDGHRRLTYRELERAALRLSQHIDALTRPDEAVAVVLPNDARFIVAAFACLAAGRPYAAIDSNYPAERNADIIAKAGLELLVVGTDTPALAPSARQLDVALAFEPAAPPGVPLAAPPPAGSPPAAPKPAPTHRPAVILHTSGSTGAPKGIANTARAILHRVQHMANSGHYHAADRFLQFSSPCTIVGVRETWSALLTGAALYVRDPQRHSLRALRRLIAEEAVTIISTVPALWRTLLDGAPDGTFRSLRIVRIGGDRVLWEDIAKLRAAVGPRCFVQTAYMSTETVGTQWFVPAHFVDHGPAVPVGYACPGNAFAILDEDGRPVPRGEVGELVFRSAHITPGQWRDGRLVAGAARPDPADSGRQIFPIGDLASVDENGLIRLAGRRDRQMKIRGQRVEPAELEAALRRCEGVSEAAVALRLETGEPALAGFIVSSRPPETAAADAMAAVRAALPSALHPSALHVLSRLPLLPGGKVDVRALQSIDLERRRLDEATDAAKAADAADAADAAGAVAAADGTAQLPESVAELVGRTDVERTSKTAREMSLAVQRCWRRSLCRQSHAANLSWDAGGGDSLKLLRLVFELEEMLKRQLPLELFDKRMRPSDMAEALVRFVQGGRGSQPVALAASNHRPAVERGDPRPLVFLFPGITSDEPRQLAFRIDLARRARFVTLDYPEWDELLRPDVDLDTVVELLQERVLAAAGDQPIHLVGYSFGGLVAFALARRLEASQRPPAFLAILDTDISEGAKDPRLTNAVANAGGAAAGLAARTARLPRFLRSGRVQQRLAFVLAKWLLAPKRRRLLRFLASWPAVSFANNFRFLLKRELRWGMRAEHGRAWRRLNPGTRLERTEVVLFRTPGTVRDCGRPDLGWGARAPDLRLVDVPGTHLSLFSDGNRPALVASFIDLLDQHSADDGRTRVRSE